MKDVYEKEVVPKLIETFKYKNVMEVPKFSKVVLNMGLGEAIQNVKILETATEELKAIAGQRPVITRARVVAPSAAGKVCRSVAW
jgi:large subunit ribosomal protein L5